MSAAVQGGPSYFDGVKIGTTQKKFLWLAAIAYIFDQMDNGTFSYAVPVLIKQWGVTPEQVAHINSLNYLGMFLGAIFGGWLSDRIGRKKGLLTGIGIFSCASILNGLATNIAMIAAARMLTGFGVIATVVIAMVYIAEMLPSENRGKYQALTIACGTCGVPLCGLFAKVVIPLSADAWRYVFFLGGCGIFLLLIGLNWLKESPRWLVSKGRIAEAENLVEEITGRKTDLSAEANKQLKKVGNLEALRVMFSRAYFKRTVVLSILAIGVTLGAFFIGQFYSTILTTSGIPVGTVITILAAASWGVPIGDLSASTVSDKGGRKIPIVIFSFICGAAMIVQGLTLIPAIIIPAMIIMRIFGGGSMSMLWTYMAESYPTHIRSNAVGLNFGTARIVACLAQLTVPGLYASYGWSGVNIINCLIVTIPALIVLLFGEKTSRKTLEEINAAA